MTAKLSMICSKQSNGAYFAICPEIKGCFTQGDTYEEAYTNLKELVDITIKGRNGKRRYRRNPVV
ncbi:MAG: type II toxin-antitoxin system HicB family antitoxin [Treponema sp.]|jgi:predicted RNase H-like HicB family nuclease|nr:type II toxin-antitoxin system HicB family antitoxin [Treponema sp.]